MLTTGVSNKTPKYMLGLKMSGITSEMISGKYHLNLIHLKKLPWFWAFNWSKRWELPELSQKLPLASLLPGRKVDLLGVTPCSLEKWDAEKSLLLGVLSPSDERRLGVFSCCHENTDDEAWCRAMSRWFMGFWGTAWLASCKNRNSLEPFRNVNIQGSLFSERT